MSSSLEKMIPTVRTPLWPGGDAMRRRVGQVSPGGPVLFCDLDRNQFVENFSALPVRRMLVLTAERYTPNAQRIMENVAQAIFQKNHLVNWLTPKEIRQLFYDHLTMERCFFEDPAEAPVDGVQHNVYSGFLLVEDRLYPLQRTGMETCYVYRNNGLLTFNLDPQHYVQLLPGDLFIACNPSDIEFLINSKSLRRFYLVFQDVPLGNPFGRKEFHSMRQGLTAPLVGIQLKEGKATGENSGQRLTLSRQQWMMAAFALMWVLAIIASRWM
jgi:hypothetical protein